MTMGTLLDATWPVRWLRTALSLLRGVRIHPSAVVSGGSRRVRIGAGSSIGPRSRLVASGAGRIVIDGHCWFAADVEIDTGTELRIGNGTTVQRRCSLMGTTRLGRGCILAPNVFVSSGTHPFRYLPELPIREQERRASQDSAVAASLDRRVWIQDDCWLGTNVVVGPGVVIGRGSIVGANAVVLQDVAPYSVVAGVPARVVGRRLEWVPPRAVVAANPADHVYALSCTIFPAVGSLEVGFAARAGESLDVALARGARVRIEYAAQETARVRIAGLDHDLRVPGGVLEIDAAGLPATNDYLLLSVEVRTSEGEPGWRIKRIAVD